MADRRNINGRNTARVGHPLGAPPVVFRQQTVSGTSSYTLFTSVSEKYRVIDVVAVATAAGGAADTVTVRNGSDAISNALDLNVVDKTVVRAGTIDDAYRDIEVGDSLVVETASGAVADVYVYCLRL